MKKPSREFGELMMGVAWNRVGISGGCYGCFFFLAASSSLLLYFLS